MRISRAVAAGVAGLTLLAGGATTANALTSYQGDDYTYDWNSRHDATTCDQEADSTPVKGVIAFTSGSNAEVKDSDGANGVCASAGPTAFNNRTISGHKTCEYRSFWPDTCGDWQRY